MEVLLAHDVSCRRIRREDTSRCITKGAYFFFHLVCSSPQGVWVTDTSTCMSGDGTESSWLSEKMSGISLSAYRRLSLSLIRPRN